MLFYDRIHVGVDTQGLFTTFPRAAPKPFFMSARKHATGIPVEESIRAYIYTNLDTCYYPQEKYGNAHQELSTELKERLVNTEGTVAVPALERRGVWDTSAR